VPLAAVPQGPSVLVFVVLVGGCNILINQRCKDKLRVVMLNICFDFIFRPYPQRLEFGMPLAAVPIGHFFRSLLCQ
jgi:hypothetical protein